MYKASVNRFNALTRKQQDSISASDLINLPAPQMQEFIYESPKNGLLNKLFDHGMILFHLKTIVQKPDLAAKISYLEFEKHLDKGSYGIVFEVIDKSPRDQTIMPQDYKRHYAMKVQKFGPEFEREFSSLSQMDSPHILKLIKGTDVEGFLVSYKSF